MSAVFLSDIHLQDCDGLKAKLVMRFLDESASQFSKLFILGDLFDVWPGTDGYLALRFRPILTLLKRLVDTGCEVHFIEGNHDFYLGDFFKNSIGINVHPLEYQCTLGNRRVLMTHGDLGNPDDFGYIALRRLLRSRPVQMVRSFMPGQLVYEIGRRTSQFSRKFQGPNDLKKEANIRDLYREYAQKQLQRGFDLVLMGHTHIPDDFKLDIDGRNCRYINLGDWVKNFTFLEFDGAEFYTKKHPIVDVV